MFLGGTPTWRLHTKLYKFGWNVSQNNSRMKNHTYLNLCKVIYISQFYHLPDSWIYLLSAFDFIFDGVTCASQQYSVTVIIIHQIFSLARDWSKRVTWHNMPQPKLGNIRVIFPNSSDIPQFSKLEFEIRCKSCFKNLRWGNVLPLFRRKT